MFLFLHYDDELTQQFYTLSNSSFIDIFEQ